MNTPHADNAAERSLTDALVSTLRALADAAESAETRRHTTTFTADASDADGNPQTGVVDAEVRIRTVGEVLRDRDT